MSGDGTRDPDSLPAARPAATPARLTASKLVIPIIVGTRPEAIKLVPIIRRRAIAVGVGAASVADIDRLNIYHATHLAMRRAIARIRSRPRSPAKPAAPSNGSSLEALAVALQRLLVPGAAPPLQRRSMVQRTE